MAKPDMMLVLECFVPHVDYEHDEDNDDALVEDELFRMLLLLLKLLRATSGSAHLLLRHLLDIKFE